MRGSRNGVKKERTVSSNGHHEPSETDQNKNILHSSLDFLTPGMMSRVTHPGHRNG